MILSVSGKINSGKDTVGKIAQVLIESPHLNNNGVLNFLKDEYHCSNVEIKKWADALKEMLCIMTGTKRKQWEDADFKNTELGEEWWYWKLERDGGFIPLFFPYSEPELFPEIREEDLELIKPTPRLLLQQLGTDCCRNVIHSNVWVNALMSKYTHGFPSVITGKYDENIPLPNWIITDTRFPNELKAVKDRGGISIRVNRPMGGSKFEGTQEEWDKLVERNKQAQHPSETSLDNATFDYEIINDGSLEDLVVKVREILTKEKLI